MVYLIRNYGDFVRELLNAGFSVGTGGNDEGIFGLLEFGWNEEPLNSPVRWHTGNPETDPWAWRVRVLDERDDIAYSKVFFRKSGYITKEWYPCFLAARRGDCAFEDAYADGTISHAAKRIYDVITEHGSLPAHDIKRYAGFQRDEKGKFESALTELQMRMYITVCGEQQKLSQKGELYSWPSSVFCTTERFWGDDVFKAAAQLNEEEAASKITEQVLKLNPSANIRKIKKFIEG